MVPSRLLRVLGIALIGLAPGSLASADILHTRDGRRIEGEAIDNGTSWTVTTRFGAIVIPSSQVERVERSASLEQRYAARRATVDLNDPDALVALGVWCERQRWRQKARELFEEAVQIEPDHPEARSWMRQELVDGVWVSDRRPLCGAGSSIPLAPRAAVRRAEEIRLARERREASQLERQLQRWFRDLAVGSDKRSTRAHMELLNHAYVTGDFDLARRATTVRDAYDEWWREVRALNARVDVRASTSTLRRPVRTVSTSLGGGRPVSIQLPELGVTTVRTTAWVPAGRGL